MSILGLPSSSEPATSVIPTTELHSVDACDVIRYIPREVSGKSVALDAMALGRVGQKERIGFQEAAAVAVTLERPMHYCSAKQ